MRSLSDLPGLILQVAGTPVGVLVSVSVSAVVYTRILISDHIGACPYRPFSNLKCQNPQLFEVGSHLKEKEEVNNCAAMWVTCNATFAHPDNQACTGSYH